MRRIFIPFVMLVSALFVLASCLGSNDDEVVYYGDTAVTSFALGTVNRYVHTTSKSGADSVYKTTYAGSSYTFYIDQVKHEIYNVDSLPKGTDVAHIICTISTKNGGTAVWKHVNSDTLRIYSSTDSIDFSQKRELRVYANDGSGYRAYQVSVNVHKEEANVFNWSALKSNSQLAAMTDMRAVCQNGKIYVYGHQGDEAVCYSTPTTNGNSWSKDNTPEVETVNTSAMTLADSEHAAWLPTQDISLIRTAKPTNPDTYQLVMVGNRSVEAYPADRHAVVWGRVDEQTAEAVAQPWFYYGAGGETHLLLPRLENLQAVGYGSGILALGGKGIGACTDSAFKNFYVSNDNGITWKTDSRFTLPSGFQSSSSSFAMTVDADNYLWIICGGSGQVWRGRLSQLGWDNPQKVF